MPPASSEEGPLPPPSGLAKGLERVLGLEPLVTEARWTPASSLLLNPRRLEIVLAAAAYPGVHLRSASKLLLSPLPSLRFHVRRLEAEGLARVRRVGNRAALFVPGTFPAWAEPLLVLWQDSLDRHVLELIQNHPGATEADLARQLVVEGPALGSSLGRLVSCGAVRRRSARGTRSYETAAPWHKLETLCRDRVADRLQVFLALLNREGLHPMLEEASTSRARLSLDGPRFRIRLTLPLDPLRNE